MAENTVSSEGILTKGLKSSLATTDIRDGKLRVVIDTGEIFLDIGTSDRKQLAIDIVKNLTEEQVTTNPAPLPLFYYTTDTHKLMYYQNDEWVIVGDNVSHATNADTATYATNSGTATYALTADAIDWINVTNKPTSIAHSVNSDTANYATNAGTAESINWSGVTNKPTSIAYADEAGVANGVDWSNVTNAPTSIDHSINADTATYATNAGTANSVDWSVITNKPTNFTDAVESVETGTTNGTIKVTKNGSTSEVSVAGLGSAAYNQSSAFAPSSHNHTTAEIDDFADSVQGIKVDNATNADTADYATNANQASNDSDGDSIKATYGVSLSINGSDISLKNKNNTTISTITVPGTEYQAGDGISLNGTTFSNAGIRDIAVNGNSINVNKNGTTSDITVPYAANAGTADYATNASTADSVTWTNVSNKPSTFAPSSHNHTTAEIEDFTDSVQGIKVDNASTADSVTWNNVSNKPSTFTPSTHNHTTADIEDFIDSVQGIKVDNASTADYATKASQDANGNSITSTYAPKASPAFSGTPTTPTPSAGDDSTKIASTAYVVAAINAAIGGITGIKYEVVTTLPSSGKTGTIYLVPKSSSQTNNYYDEYIWIESSTKFEKIGDTEIDLSQYVNSVTTNGDGNAVTSITKSGNGITFTKGSTFLTKHPDISMDTNTTSTGAPSFGGTFTAIDSVTKDGNGHVTKVNTKTVTVPSSTASTTSAGLVPKHNGSTAEYLRGDNTWQTLANSHNHTTANISNFTNAVKGIKVSNSGTADYATTAGTANGVAWANVSNKPTSIAHSDVADSANAVTWSNVSNKPSSFTPSSHNHTTANISNFTNAVKGIKVSNSGTADYATTAGSANAVTWTNVSNKPSTFTPSTHNHTTADITNFASHNHTTANITNFVANVKTIKVNNASTADYAGTAGSANAVTWTNVSNKPSTFTPSTHNHTTANITNFAAAVRALKPTNAGTADTATTANNIPVNPSDTSGMNIWITT